MSITGFMNLILHINYCNVESIEEKIFEETRGLVLKGEVENE